MTAGAVNGIAADADTDDAGSAVGIPVAIRPISPRLCRGAVRELGVVWRFDPPAEPGASGVVGVTGFNDQVLDDFLSQHQILLRLDNPFHLLLVRLLVGLGARAVHGRALAAIEQAELDAGGVDCPAHRPPQRVNLADNLPLGHAADRRIATHLRHGIAVGGQQRRARPHPRRRQRRFTPGMPGADDENVEFVGSLSHLSARKSQPK